MMNDIKRVMKLIQYGDQFFAYAVTGIIWSVLGVIVMFVSAGMGSCHLMVILAMFAPTMFMQCFASLEAGGMTASSGKRRFLSIWGQDLLGTGGMGVMFVMILVVITIKCILYPDARELIGGTILCAGLSAAVMLVYMPLVNKSFIGGVAAFMLVYMYYSMAGFFILEKWKPSYGVGLLLGVLAYILGGVASHFIRVWLYKKPVSKFSLGAEMRKYM